MGERKPSIRKKWRAAVSLLLAILLVLPVGVVKGETLNQDDRMAVCFDALKEEEIGYVKSSTSNERPRCWPYMRGDDIEINGRTPVVEEGEQTSFENKLADAFRDAISKAVYFDHNHCSDGRNHGRALWSLADESGEYATLPQGKAFYGKPYSIIVVFQGERVEHPGIAGEVRNYLAKRDTPIKVSFHQQIQPKLYGVTLETGDTIDDPAS